MIRKANKHNHYKSKKKSPKFFSIGGGKGGIGKSFLTSNLAIASAKSGYKTLVIDLDFGGANAHTYLEVRRPKYSAFDFVNGEVSELQSIVCETQFENLSIIAGKDEMSKCNTINELQIEYLFDEIKNLNFDRIFFDLGAGTNFETLNGFLCSDFKITLSTPEPTSIENTYHFLKKGFYAHLKNIAQEHGFSEQINSILKDSTLKHIKNPAQLLNHIGQEFGRTGEKIVYGFDSFKPLIVINQCRSPQDFKLGESLAQICRKYFGLKAFSLGHLSFENHVWQSVRSMRPLSIEYPHCITLKEIEDINRKINAIEKNHFYRYSVAV